jgi:hypothetical protein
MKISLITTAAAAIKTRWRFDMINKSTIPATKKEAGVSHPGMMGDGTEEQNLDELGNPAARIKKEEVDAAFGKKNQKK